MIITKTIIGTRIALFILTIVLTSGYKLYTDVTEGSIKNVLREVTGWQVDPCEKNDKKCQDPFKQPSKVDVIGILGSR